jgi:upstream activation factor subunit UAF30
MLARPQVVKQLWVYIKGNGLQKSTNKKVIVCDEKLQKVFKAPEIDMFQMNKVLGRCVSLALIIVLDVDIPSHLRTADE